jgi:hypothetical protein
LKGTSDDKNFILLRDSGFRGCGLDVVSYGNLKVVHKGVMRKTLPVNRFIIQFVEVKWEYNGETGTGKKNACPLKPIF